MWEKRKDRSPRFFYFFFVVRRILYIFMCFGLQDEPLIYEILILEFMNTFMLIYQGYFRPAYNLFENRVELFNEFNVSICSTMIVCFTAFVADQETQFLVGWTFCCLILLQILINLVIIFYYSFRSSSLMVRFGVNQTIARCCRFLLRKKEPIPAPKPNLHPIEIRKIDLQEKKRRLQ